VDYFYSAAMLRLRGALWPIFAPALIVVVTRGNFTYQVGDAGHSLPSP